MRRPLLALLLMLPLGLAACGAPTPEPEPIRWMQAKPGRVVASLEAAVVERIAPDRIVLEARWTPGALDGACLVDLGLPAGVLIIEGAERIDLDPEADPGHARWVLEFPRDGRDLDAVVRYCVETAAGLRAAHVAVRLTSTR